MARVVVNSLNQARRKRVRKTLLRKYGNICQWCFQRIDLSITAMDDPMGFSIDHIIKLADGGTHAVSNLQPMHKKCNSEKN
jgi:5-methylcytosine-specific restriction endonuclease McrA